MGKVRIPRGFEEYLELNKCAVCEKNDYNIKYKIPREFYQPEKYLSISWASPWKIPVWTIVECNNCGFVWTNPRIKSTYLFHLYPDKMFVNEEAGVIRGANSVEIWKEELRDVVKITKIKPKNSQILDVGCANGFSLKAAEKLGFKSAYGVEISKMACDYAKSNLNLKNIFCGTLLEAKYPSESFDIVTLYDVIEHVPNPREILVEVSRILKADGLIVLKQMDINSELSKKYKEKWAYIAPAAHLYYFSKPTISRLMEEVGFDLVNISSDKVKPYTIKKMVKERLKKILWPLIIRKRGMKTQDICCHLTPVLGGLGQDSMMRVIFRKNHY